MWGNKCKGRLFLIPHPHLLDKSRFVAFSDCVIAETEGWEAGEAMTQQQPSLPGWWPELGCDMLS